MSQHRTVNERQFHDEWAAGTDLSQINVWQINEACTAPEMRHIIRRLGPLRGKRLLDIGCGLGEASVYFALNGAKVVASDLSQGMLEATERLGELHGVKIETLLSAAEDLNLKENDVFDVIYAGNLLHHVDIEETLIRAKRHLAPGGLFVTWDPLAYNPAINIYRAIATDVRTPDEHPLTWKDIKLFSYHFKQVEARYFWLSTLLIFICMVLLERRNPNKERLWKAVVSESTRWRWLYLPLEKLDQMLLMILPPLRLLCWNVVLISSDPN